MKNIRRMGAMGMLLMFGVSLCAQVVVTRPDKSVVEKFRAVSGVSLDRVIAMSPAKLEKTLMNHNFHTPTAIDDLKGEIAWARSVGKDVIKIYKKRPGYAHSHMGDYELLKEYCAKVADTKLDKAGTTLEMNEAAGFDYRVSRLLTFYLYGELRDATPAKAADQLYAMLFAGEMMMNGISSCCGDIAKMESWGGSIMSVKYLDACSMSYKIWNGMLQEDVIIMYGDSHLDNKTEDGRMKFLNAVAERIKQLRAEYDSDLDASMEIEALMQYAETAEIYSSMWESAQKGWIEACDKMYLLDAFEVNNGAMYESQYNLLQQE